MSSSLPPQSTLPESVVVEVATLTDEDRRVIQKCRGGHNRLGFCYQLTFVKVFNCFSSQVQMEINTQLLAFSSLQLGIPIDLINIYQKRRQTITEHQEQIRVYLQLNRFNNSSIHQLSEFLFCEAQRTTNRHILLSKAECFLKENKILQPAQDTLERLIANQRKKAQKYIYHRMLTLIDSNHYSSLDILLQSDEIRFSRLQQLKQPPAIPSPKALITLTRKLEIIQEIDIADIDISWINNNYQRSLAKYVMRCSVKRLKKLEQGLRYTALICFLKHLRLDTIDHIIDMQHKLMLKIYNRAQNQLDEATQKQRKHFKKSEILITEITDILLDITIEDSQVRRTIFEQVGRKNLEQHAFSSKSWLSGKFSHVFHLILERFTYLRQFSPSFIANLEFEGKSERSLNLVKAIQVLQEFNQNQKRKLPDNIPLSFVPKKLLPFVQPQGNVDRQAWECVLLAGIRDEIKVGNLTVIGSKRFGNFDNFFMTFSEWEKERSAFFQRSRLPENPREAKDYLANLLNKAFDMYLNKQIDNSYATVKDGHWVLSVDPGEALTKEEETALDKLKSWLKKHMRPIKLPQLLIEVDNDLHFTQEFMLIHQRQSRQVDDVCAIIATVMAHGCFIGPYTMARLTESVTYEQIRRITDWQLTEDAQRAALALIVNAITGLDITKHWGRGKTSTSDSQRFSYSRRTLQQTFSTQFRDFALEFYTFVADNYAPYFSLPIECTDRDSPYVLDGILYNESDLVIEEHFTDTHGYTEINFAGFGMLGKTFSPRIRGVQHQRLYRIDKEKDYGCLSPLVHGKDRLIHMEWIEEQWDRMGHFYASLASGHTTASTALKRLTGFSPKNHFYRANRELGRVFKTENILTYMSDPLLRQNRRKGLLKGEQIHQLARDIAYGKRGRISARDLQEQQNTCSCLTLIMACIIYWQAKEIKRIVDAYGYELDPSCLAMLPHISPVGWDNVILYGEYVLNKNLVK